MHHLKNKTHVQTFVISVWKHWRSGDSKKTRNKIHSDVSLNLKKVSDKVQINAIIKALVCIHMPFRDREKNGNNMQLTVKEDFMQQTLQTVCVVIPLLQIINTMKRKTGVMWGPEVISQTDRLEMEQYHSLLPSWAACFSVCYISLVFMRLCPHAASKTILW